MTAPPLPQPPPLSGTLERFATATADLLAVDSATTLQDHLRALAELSGADLLLLYHGATGAAVFDLVAAFGLPAESAAALRRHAPDDTGGGVAAELAGLGVRARRDVPLCADGDCIGLLVFGSRRWNAFHPDMLRVFTAAAAQIAVVLQHRLAEEGDAEAGLSSEVPPTSAAEPLLFRRRRDRFVALLAHELRNPVAPIRSGLDLLATDRLDAAARRETVQMMQRQLAQLVHLIDDFLDTARLNTGRLEAQRRPVQLISALDSALESVEPAIRARRQHVRRIGWGAARLVVDADPVRLTQAFANLLASGAAATPTDGTLAVRLAADAESATIAFEDQGPPIAAGDGDPFWFDAFATAATKNADQAGVGLGLVGSLLAMNDGTVVANNRDGGGRVFTVTLPVTSRDAVPGLPEPAGATLPSHRILVVDDNRDGAESLGLLFQLDGHRVRLAHDGPEAVSAASEFEPEIIVMDLGLPGFSGHEAIARIRSAAGRTRPRIIALTGWGTRADRDASARAGADLHLVKPVAVADLTRAIDALLDAVEPLSSPR